MQKICVILGLASYLLSEFACTHDTYLDEWAVHIDGGHREALRFAKRHDLMLVDKIGSLDDHYTFKLHHNRKKRMITENDVNQFESKLRSHENVRWLERQRKLRRVKRDYLNDNLHENTLIDPLWDKTWYLNGVINGNQMPDMNVTGAWRLGYSGRGVSVTFLDDGLEHNHPDLQQNYDPKASTDINDRDNDPMPRYDPTNENKHGTRCAGEVGAVANNSICSVGVAYNAGVGGIRMLDGDISDSVEASSLSFNNQHIDIYSASWGPDDNGEVVDGPGPLAQKAFVEGITKGRGGKGSIFVWASGNGGRYGDSCSCDGYANSIYTLSISSTSEKSEKPWYLEECTSTLATTYSSGDEKSGEHDVVTTDINHKCTEKHTGTSAAAPLAAGIIALALEANPNLTWRDVMFLIVLTSRPKAIKSNNYIQNKQGFLVSNTYGFGLMDAGRMTELAHKWKRVPEMSSCSTKSSKFKPETVETSSNRIESILYTDACEDTSSEVNYTEQVEAVVSIRTPRRGALEIYLTSPSGTRSLILPRRPADKYSDGFKNWSFMSVQLWGESPKGYWKLEIIPKEAVEVHLERFDLIIHGTKEEPISYRSLMGFDSHNVSRIRHVKAQILSAYTTNLSSSSSSFNHLNNTFKFFICFLMTLIEASKFVR